MTNFRDRLKQLRKNSAVSQKKLGECLGVTQNAIFNWESGKTEPNAEMIEKIAAYFCVSPAYLMGWTDEVIDQPITLAAHFDGDEYTDEELEEIRKFAEFVKSRRKDTE